MNPILVPSLLLALAAVPSPQDGGVSPIPAARPVSPADRLAPEIRQLDPLAEGWDTEALNTAGGARLKVLGEWLHKTHELTPDSVSDLIADGFACTRLRPAKLDEVYSNSGLRVLRGTVPEEKLEGAAGLVRAWQDLAGAYADHADVHVKWKILRVTPLGEREGGRYATEVLFQSWGDAPKGIAMQRADWTVDWLWPDESKPPRIAGIRVARHQESVAPRPMFSDCTESVIGASRAWKEQLLRGTDDWCARLDLASGMNQYAHNGLAIGDVDGDGLEDLYLCQGGGLPNRLFRHERDGTATDVSAAAGVDWLDETTSALFVDLDGDGDEDLVVALERAVLVARNDGPSPGRPVRFEVASEIPFRGGYSLAAADVDGDGRLDFYVCRYSTSNVSTGLPSPYHDANNGPPNALFQNKGGFQFEDVTAQVGLDQNNQRFSFAAAWADYDEDGDLDLYVANDFGRNNLYRNDGGHFRDVAAEAGVEDISAGMGVSWGDADGDGHLDLYVSNMFSSAGQRVAYQRRFKPATDARTRGEFQRHARGDSLFRNRGDGTFEDVTEPSGTGMGRWAWGAQFVDMNGDGLSDLFVPNGFVTNEDPEDL